MKIALSDFITINKNWAMPMFGRLFSRKPRADLPHEIYGGLVARGRNPVLFQDLGVPDTMNGRFDMMVMHVFLLSFRLKNEDAACRALSQDIFDSFLLDMDRGLREEGVGDLTVPKRIKKMTQIFYGRVRAYEEPVNNQDKEALAAVIDRNIFTDNSDPQNSRKLADYMLRLHRHIKALPSKSLLEGRLALETIDPAN